MINLEQDLFFKSLKKYEVSTNALEQRMCCLKNILKIQISKTRGSNNYRF